MTSDGLMEITNGNGTFIQIGTDILRSKIGNNAKLLYAFLWDFADRASRDGWPSRRTLADLMGTSLDTVDRAMKELVGFGAVRVVKRFTERGDQTSNGYYLTTFSERAIGSAPPPQPHPCGHPSRTHAATPAAPQGYEQEPLKQEPIKQEKSNKELAQIEPKIGFDDFWAVYAKRKARADAEKAWDKAVRLADPTRIIAMASEQWASPYRPDAQFMPYPATWLNKRQWDDDPFEAPESRVAPVAPPVYREKRSTQQARILGDHYRAEEAREMRVIDDGAVYADFILKDVP